MEKIRVFGYARKSPDDKESTDTSILNQTKLFKSICDEKGWELVEVFIDSNVSGSDRDRKQFSIMLRRIYANEADYIIVKDQDRFSRDISVFRDTLIDLEARQKKVYSHMKFGFLSHEDLGDSVKAVVDDNYIFTQRKKTNVLFNQKIDEGLPVFKAPFGYKNDKKTKSFSILAREAKIVLNVCFSYALGADYKDIIKENKIDKSKYYRIIKNAKNGLYNGFIYYEKKIKDSSKKVIRLEPVIYKGNHKPIISKELFLKINPDFNFPEDKII